DEPVRAAVEHAFGAAGKPFAAIAYRGVSRAIDRYAADWIAMHTEACEATRIRGEQSDEVLSLRMVCLDWRLAELKALTALFAQADAAVVEKSVEAAQALTSLAGCADAAALRAQVRPPADAAARAAVEEQRDRLAV